MECWASGPLSAASSTDEDSAQMPSKALSHCTAALMPAGSVTRIPSSAFALELVVKLRELAISSDPPGPSNNSDFAWWIPRGEIPQHASQGVHLRPTYADLIADLID